MLDWQRDRSPMAPDDSPAFLEPISDELRELFLKSSTEPRDILIGSQHVSSRPQNLYGFEFDAVSVDIQGQVQVQL